MRSPEIDALRHLGLTEYGARAYATLVALGPSTGPEVAEAAPLPRTRVYSVLADLARRGWADAEDGRPRRYRARRPRERMDAERARLDELLARATATLESQYHDVSSRFAGPLWFVKGARSLADRSVEMVQRARRDVLLFASFPFPVDEAPLARALRAALRRGVRVRVTVPDLSAPFARTLAASGAETRVLFLPPRVLLVDESQGLVAFPSRSPDGPDFKGVWNPSPVLVEMLTSGVAEMWERAELAPPAAPRASRPRKGRGAPRRA